MPRPRLPTGYLLHHTAMKTEAWGIPWVVRYVAASGSRATAQQVPNHLEEMSRVHVVVGPVLYRESGPREVFSGGRAADGAARVAPGADETGVGLQDRVGRCRAISASTIIRCRLRARFARFSLAGGFEPRKVGLQSQASTETAGSGGRGRRIPAGRGSLSRPASRDWRPATRDRGVAARISSGDRTLLARFSANARALRAPVGQEVLGVERLPSGQMARRRSAPPLHVSPFRVESGITSTKSRRPATIQTTNSAWPSSPRRPPGTDRRFHPRRRARMGQYHLSWASVKIGSRVSSAGAGRASSQLRHPSSIDA